MKIDVKTLPVNEIIQDIAEKFKTPVQDLGPVLSLSVPQELGEGVIRATHLDGGIGIITYACTFNRDVELCFSLNTVHPLKFIFCAEGEVAHSFQESEEVTTIQTYQNIIVSSSGYNGHKLLFKAGKTTHVSSLEIIRSTFSNRSNYGYSDLEPKLQQLFKDEVAENQFRYHGNYGLKAADIMEELYAGDFTGFLRSIYLEGKCYEMLSAQIAQYQEDEAQDKLPTILRKTDIEKVDYVARRIMGDIGTNFTVESLAKEAGTNINKLQEAFKHVYGLTVNKYIQHQKLEVAKDLLLNSEKNISEIVVAIGLNNRSYFSKVFKEKYGVNPKYFLRSRRADAEEADEGLPE